MSNTKNSADIKRLKTELASVKAELELYKNRKVIRLIGAGHRVAKMVLPQSVVKTVQSRAKSTADTVRKKYLVDVSTDNASLISDEHIIPNLRVISTSNGVPSFPNIAPIVCVNENWEKTLRPDIRSADAIMFELPRSTDIDFPYQVAKKIAQAAENETLPIVIIVHETKQLQEDLLYFATTIVCLDKQVYEEANKQFAKTRVHFVTPFLKNRSANPIGWSFYPTVSLQVVGEKQLDEKSNAVYDALSQTLSEKDKRKTPDSSPVSIKGAVPLELKQAFAVLCLPQLFNSREEFEASILKLLASGCLVFTTDQTIVQSYNLPALNLASDKKVIKKLADLVYREQASIFSRRAVLHSQTEKSRFMDIVKKAKISLDINRKISIILSTNRPDYIKHAIENVKKQKEVDVELVLILHGGAFDKTAIKTMLKKSGLAYQLLSLPADMRFGECLNKGLDASTGYFITKFDDDDYYGEYHLLDLVVAMDFSNATVVGKWGHFVYLNDSKEMLNYQLDRTEIYGGHIPGGTFLMKRSTLDEFRFGRVRNAIDSELWDRIKAAGGRLYSTHRYNYVRVRHEDNTWSADIDFFKERSDGQHHSALPRDGFI